MGSSEFSMPTLEKLYSSNHELVCIYSNQPKQKGRGMNQSHTVVGNFAIKNNIELRTPKSLRDEEVKSQFLGTEHDIVIVVSYGKILPEYTLSSGKYNAINLHPSSLPRWRGAAPIERCIEAGDLESKICVMNMSIGLDEGDLLMTEDFNITKDDDSISIAKYCANRGGDMILDTLDRIENIKPIKQAENGVLYAKKIDKSELYISDIASISAFDLFNKIRAFASYRGLWIETQYGKIRFKKAKILESSNCQNPYIDENLNIHMDNSIISPIIIQKEGGKEMHIDLFLNGIRNKK